MRALAAALVFACCTAWAGDLSRFISPMSNPVYFGDPRVHNWVRAVGLYNWFPDEVDTTIGDVDLSGYASGGALQFGLKLTDRLALVAVKSGYLNCNPGKTLGDHDGWLDLAGGLQYALVESPEQDLVVSARLIYEIPSGSREAFQEAGDGKIDPAVLFLKGFGNLQVAGTLGFVIPTNAAKDNTLFYQAYHVSYAIPLSASLSLHPLVEMSHFHVLEDGKRDLADFLDTGSTADLVAAIARFNGCDVVNLGGTNSDENPDMVTFAFGLRLKASRWLQLGMAYEIPATDERVGLTRARLTWDAVVSIPFALPF